MGSRQMPHVPLGKHYIDTSVLVDWLWGGKGSEAAKRFMYEVERGSVTGVVSGWTLMELISVVRVMIARLGETSETGVEQEVASSLEKVFRLKNVEFVAAETDSENGQEPGEASLWHALKVSLERLRMAHYKIEAFGDPPQEKIVGIGSSDALHIYIAEKAICDFLATTDKGFLLDTWPVRVYHVRR